MADQVIEKLVWIDMEMTGLDLKKDKIMQIACLITDLDLNILNPEGFVLHLKISKKDLNNMDPFVKEMHTKNGLIDKSIKSKVTLKAADKLITDYLRNYITEKASPLCGSTIACDRMFIEYNMPLLKNFLHYRNIDVSTFKQVFNFKNLPNLPKYVGDHEALSDIKASIESLKYYVTFLQKQV